MDKLLTASAIIAGLILVIFLSLCSSATSITDDDVTSGNSDGFGYNPLDLEFEDDSEDHADECPHLHLANHTSDDNSTHSCHVQGFMKSFRVESVKRDILRKLNLASPPNISVGIIPQVPRLQALIDKVGKDHNNYDDEPKSTFILFGKASDEDTAVDDECRFHLKNDLFTKRLERASLGLFVRKPKRYESKWTGWLLISFDNNLVLKKKLTMVANETNRWYTFNITAVARDWFFQRKREILMNVVGSDSTGTPLPVVKPLQESEEHFKPYLFLKVKEPISSRLKRNLNEDCIEGDHERRCCRYPLIINFAEMGWNWIIVPASYNAYYCSGECPVSQTGSNLYLQIKEINEGAKCCTGRKFSSISIIYFDESRNIVLSRVPNMVVEQCECI